MNADDIWSQREKNGKKVTVIRGVKNAPAVLLNLKRRFGCGGTIKDGAIRLQGDWVRKLKMIGDVK